ncbi:hypothetical protein L323_14485 [Ruminiclostridium papyrosolvens C7]|uniref:Uncharacterized protein n=1 Tax=Ruminiclostridium papyrosolvens C7 TaxID=1330534 RepID=U4R0B5_9FIRM|nr:hypothetical protein L323_14485 [Ruminiclostridium papyrosolvens C7]
MDYKKVLENQMEQNKEIQMKIKTNLNEITTKLEEATDN